MYLEANKDDNGGKENNGPTCYRANSPTNTHTHTHTQSLYHDWSLTISSSFTLTL